MAMVKCKECKNQISSKANACPHCGAKRTKTPVGCAVVLTFLLICFIIGISQTANESKPTRSTPSSQAPVSHPKPAACTPDHTKVNIPALFGKRHSSLTSVFPGLPTTDAGSSAKIVGWDGWKAVYLSFNGAGRLASVSFTPIEPLSEFESKRIVQETYGVSLPSTYEKRAPALVAYRDMSGTIKTVNFSFVDWKTRDHRIGEIEIFFNIGWNE